MFILIEKIVFIAVLFLLLVALLAGFFAPYFEMTTFNKFSKTKATYFDAVFGQLRISPDK